MFQKLGESLVKLAEMNGELIDYESLIRKNIRLTTDLANAMAMFATVTDEEQSKELETVISNKGIALMLNTILTLATFDTQLDKVVIKQLYQAFVQKAVLPTKSKFVEWYVTNILGLDLASISELLDS